METLNEYIEKQMKDPAFRKAYIEQLPEMERIRAKIKKQIEAKSKKSKTKV